MSRCLILDSKRPVLVGFSLSLFLPPVPGESELLLLGVDVRLRTEAL